MLIHANHWINDSWAFDSNLVARSVPLTIPKFRYLAWQQNQQNPTTASIELQLWGAVTNNRAVNVRDYKSSTSSRPLTSLRVGFGGEQVASLTNPYGFGLGYNNYPRFISSILTKHKLLSRFYPLGASYGDTGSQTGNSVGAHLATTEQFALTFLEIANNFPPTWTDPSNNNSFSFTPALSTIYHVELYHPFTLLSWALPWTNDFGFSFIKGREVTTWSRSIAWVPRPQFTIPSP